MQGIRATVVTLAALLALGAGIALAQDDPAGDENVAALSAPPQADPGVELVSRRTAASQTFRLPDGRLQTRIFESPIHYRDANGDWKPIGDQLEEVEGGGLSNGPNRFDVSLPDHLGANPVRLSVGGEWVSSELIGPASTEAQLEGDTASYESADGGTSFEFVGLANGIKEDIVIAGPSEPSTFRFALDASDGLTPTLADDGSVEFRNAEGDVVVALPAPVISDSAPGALPVSHAVHYTLAPQDEGEWLLTVEADRDWLTQPERIWPVRIDPTIRVESPALDCQFSGYVGTVGRHDCGFEGRTLLYSRGLYSLTSADYIARTALRFDISAIPSSAYVTQATVGVHTAYAARNTSGAELRRATKPWTGALNWRTYNGTNAWTTEGGDFTSEGASILTSERGTQAGWWNFSSASLATVVQEWVSSTDTAANQGFILKLVDDKVRSCTETGCTERLIRWASSVTADQSKRPWLEVTYYPAAPSTSQVVSPAEGTQTARRLKLKAGWSVAGVTGVSFQFREGSSGRFQTIPTSLVRNAQGQEVSWPIAVQGVNQSEPLFFDAAHATSTLQSKGGKVQVRVLFEGSLGVAGYSAPVNATVDRFVGGTRDASTAVGPGSVDLLTGNFTVGRTDVSIPAFGSALEFSRTHNSRDAGSAGNTGVLGRGWKPGAPVEAAGGAEWRSVRRVLPTAQEQEEGLGEYLLLTDLEGYEYTFELAGGNYVTPPELSGLVLISQAAGTQFALTDPDGNRTIFQNSAGGTEYLPVSVSQTGGSTNSTQMVYEILGGNRRLKMIIAPSATGVSCNETNATTTLGCRALTLDYKKQATGALPPRWEIASSASNTTVRRAP